MSEVKTLDEILSTALAVTNATIVHLHRGLFVSKFTFFGEIALRWGPFVGNSRVRVEGQTNTGRSVHAELILMFKRLKTQEEGERSFPIDYVYISVRERVDDFNEHFKCRFIDEKFDFTKLAMSPEELRHSA